MPYSLIYFILLVSAGLSISSSITSFYRYFSSQTIVWSIQSLLLHIGLLCLVSKSLNHSNSNHKILSFVSLGMPFIGYAFLFCSPFIFKASENDWFSLGPVILGLCFFSITSLSSFIIGTFLHFKKSKFILLYSLTIILSLAGIRECLRIFNI